MYMGWLAQPGCVWFQYASMNAADAFELKIAALSETTTTYLFSVTVSGTLVIMSGS